MPAMTPYPTYPMGPPPPPVRGADRTGTIASSVIGAVCLLLTIAVVAFTSDEIDSPGAIPGSRPGGGPNSTVDVADSAVPLAELKRSFPLPPGTVPSHLDPGLLPVGTRAYDVPAPLRSVRTFYERRLARLGYTYDTASPTRTSAGGRIVGWHGSIMVDRDGVPDAVGFLSLDVDYFGGGPGVVTIQVSFHE